MEALTEMLRQCCPEGRYARKRLELLLSHTREELLAQSWPDFSFDYLRDARCRCLDEEILADAAAHLEAIHRGDVPYVGYKAFEEADVNAIVSAFRRAAQRNEPWLAPVAHRLQTLSC